jgi:hypothetical protein
MSTSLKKNDTIERFMELFQKGYEAWVEAGKLVSEQLETDPDFAEKVHDAHPEISCDIIYAFDRLGRKELYPKLLISDSPGAKRLRRLPYSSQEKYCKEPVPLLIRNEKGWQTLNTSVFNLTPEQAAQIFDGESMRTEAEQRAWVENKATKSLVQIDEPYRVSGRKLIVIQPCQFTAGQLARVLAEIEG